MRRILLIGLGILLVLYVGMWVRSYYRLDSLTRYWAPSDQICLSSSHGTLRLFHRTAPCRGGWLWGSFNPRTPSNSFDLQYTLFDIYAKGAGRKWSVWALSGGAGDAGLFFVGDWDPAWKPAPRDRYWYIDLPWWVPTLCCVAALVCMLVRSPGLRRRSRLAHNLCPTCAYDLRAHKAGDRCPECGTPIPSPSR